MVKYSANMGIYGRQWHFKKKYVYSLFVYILFYFCSKTVYKPVSVLCSYPSRINITINFKQPTQTTFWSNIRLYLVLLPVGFAMPTMLPLLRWALTPPFHPYHSGGIFSVALSLKFPPPGVTRHRCSWRPDFPLL